MKINGYTLDKEQLKPIIENKPYSLIIAGAGSGKTLTLIGKIKYLLDQGYATNEEILCLSFTNETTQNLKTNIQKNCHTICPVFTFHKLALTILKEKNFTIASPTLLEETITEFFASACLGNKTLQNIIYHKFTLFKKPWSKLLKSKPLLNYQKTILTFINLFQNKDLSLQDFKNFFNTQKYIPDLCIIYAILLLYETEKQSTNSIDFDDMIKLATQYLKEHKPSLPYKYIIIDEFQDTSLVRFNLIQEILHLTNASLCVVGDDYQSIYRFSGCDNNLFLNFQNYFPNTTIYKLEKTYRNSEELITIAGKFIQKNPYQIKKNLKSDKHLKNPLKLIYYTNPKKALINLIHTLDPTKEILILSRTSYDLKNYTTYTQKKNNYITIPTLENYSIRYLTIHKSKGLESDIVILLNVSNDLYGIPCQRKDEHILELIQNQETYPYDEERRLFYVALTRTKSHIYLLIPKKNPSIFLKEIKHLTTQKRRIKFP